MLFLVRGKCFLDNIAIPPSSSRLAIRKRSLRLSPVEARLVIGVGLLVEDVGDEVGVLGSVVGVRT